MGRKLGALSLFGERSWVPIYHNVAWVEAYLPTKWHLDPSSHLATTDMGRKLVGAVPQWGGDLGPHLIQSRLDEAYLHTKWHLDPCSHLAATDMGRKLGAVPLWERGRWVPI